MPKFEYEVSEAEIMMEEKIGATDESLISFRLNGPMEEPSRNVQPIDKPMSDKDLAVQFPRMKTKRRLTRKEKWNKKMLQYDNKASTSNWSESNGSVTNDGGP